MNEKNSSNEQVLKPALLLTAVTVALLVPFLHKAFHIDDTLFLRAARQIAENPLDFYGSIVNWYGCDVRMSEVNQNPPLVSYLIAAMASLFGWGEISMHAAFLLPAVAVTLGTWRLARFFCPHPIIAALTMVVTPVFLVSSTNLMSDTTMLALFIWGLAYWVHGLERNLWAPCLISMLLITAATLSKYFAITAVPLLALLTLTRNHRPDPRLILLLLPVAALLGFDKWSETHYGHGLFASAASYANGLQIQTMATFWSKLLIGFSFIGGCLIVFLFFSPRLFSRRQLLAGCGGLTTIAVLLAVTGYIGQFPLASDNHLNYLLIFQLSLFIMTGAAIVGQSVRDLIRHNNSDSLFLFCWMAGTFIFTVFVNWTISARNILPIAPCIAILIMRQLPNTRQPAGRIFWPLVPTAILSLFVAWADASLANIQRTVSRQISAEFATRPGIVWFQGHWGFQHYMEEAGFKPLDFDHTPMQPGDLMILPVNNSGIQYPPPGIVLMKIIRVKSAWFISTMEKNSLLGAGFYTHLWGPLPYSFGKAPDEMFLVFSVVRNYTMPETIGKEKLM